MEEEHYKWFMRNAQPVLLALVVVVGLLGNFVTVIVVLCNKRMRSTTNILITNKAVADIIYLVCYLPFSAYHFSQFDWPFGDRWCRISIYLAHVCVYVSSFTLMLMTLNRFFAAAHITPFACIVAGSRIPLTISCTWIVILLTCVPMLFFHGEMEFFNYEKKNMDCSFLMDDFGHIYFHHCIWFFLSSYAIPLAIAFVFFLLLLKMRVTPGDRGSSDNPQSKERATRLVVAAVVAYVVCLSPIQIIRLLICVNAYTFHERNMMLMVVANVLAEFNSCVNPILCVFLSANFRSAFRKFLCRGSCNKVCANSTPAKTDKKAEEISNASSETYL